MKAHGQIIMASPTGTLAAGGTATLTTTMSEPGIYHLSKMVVGVCAGDTALGTENPHLTESLAISSISINGAQELVRGRNDVVAPLGAFSAYRQLNNNYLPNIPVASGDTVAITIANEALNTGTLDCSFAAAFTPRNARDRVAAPPPSASTLDTPCTYVGSVVDDLAGPSTGGSCVLTFDEAGIFDLTSLQARGVCDLTATAALTDWWDGLPFVEIGQILLPNGNDIVVGQNSAVLSGPYLASGSRGFSWANLGAIFVNGGDTITFNAIANTGVDDVTFSFGGRFWPGMGC